MDFFPVDWFHEDATPAGSEPHFRIVASGKTVDDKSVCVRIRFTPYFFIEIPSEWSDSRARTFAIETARRHGALQTKCMPLERKSAWGFSGGQRKKLVQLAFPTLRAMRFARKALSRNHQTYEASVDPVIRVFHLRDVSPAAWVRVAKSWDPPGGRISYADVEVETSFEHLGPSQETRQPPLVVASYDLEVTSVSGRFPLAENTGDQIIQVSTAFQKYGDPAPYLKSVVCLGDTADVEGALIVSVQEEAELLHKWMDLLRREKVDIMVGHNTHQ